MCLNSITLVKIAIKIALNSLSQMCRFCERFVLSVLMYYTTILTNYVLILHKIFGTMSIKAGERRD